MKICKMISEAGVVALALSAALFGVSLVQAQGNGQAAPAPSTQSGGNGGQGQQGQNGRGGRGRGPAIDPAEEAALKAFNSATDLDGKIQAGEDFDQKFPNSHYSEGVDSELVTLYYDKQDWPKFYATSDKVVAKDPDNVPVLTLVGWVIPRVYQADDPAEPAKLDQSEKYEKHALEIIAAMPKPAQLSDDAFNQAKASAASEAHSGLGMTYFRRNDFENSAKELQIATTEGEIDPSDLYILGVDYQKLNRNSDAADAFTKCSQVPGTLQDKCKQGAASLQGSSMTPSPAAGSK